MTDNNDPTNHDCSLSPDDGCSTCEALYAPRTQETAPTRPDYTFKRKLQSADYPAGAWLI